MSTLDDWPWAHCPKCDRYVLTAERGDGVIILAPHETYYEENMGALRKRPCKGSDKDVNT